MISQNFEKVEEADFPVIFSENFLESSFYKACLKEFSSLDISSWPVVMGSRSRLSNDDKNFYSVLANNPSLERLYELVNTKEFCSNLFEALGYKTNDFNYHASHLRQSSNNVRGVITALLNRWKIIRFFKPLVYRVLVKPFRQGAWSKNSAIEANDIYIHFDISIAKNGYVSSPHLDSPKRVAAFLLYFSEAEETGGSGGDFTVYREIDGVRGQQDLSFTNVIPVTSFSPKHNLFVSFVSSDLAYHGVPEIQGATHPRRFIYVGISKVL